MKFLPKLGLCLFTCLPLLAQDSEAPREVFAHHTDQPIELDGILNEPAWSEVKPASNFIQREPLEGEPATEETQVRILYDDEAIYFGVSAYDTEPDRIVINSLKQDFPLRTTDRFSVYLDTFHDNRNAYGFYVNPGGAIGDRQAVDEGKDENPAWEDIWETGTSITEAGWFAEIRIPFKSLRFPKSKLQDWGINFQRRIGRKNEQSFWAPMPRRFTAFNLSYAGSLKGLEDVHPGRNLKVKPFVSSNLRKLAGDDFETEGDAGLDVKYGLSPSFTLDVTVNTDFSEVEVDEQQINLTRFSLFFPEKREFFLENAGIFLFGQTDRRGVASREFIPFFSRRIGLSSEGRPVPILAGARLTGRAGKYGVGVMNIQTREFQTEPANNFTVFRLKRNVLDQSELSVLLVNRQSDRAGDYNRTFGLDANFRFWRDLLISSFVAATRTPGLEEDDLASRIWLEWRTNLWEARSGYLTIGKNFDAEVGFVPRVDMRKSDSSLGWRPRPEGIPWIREFFPNVRLQYITDQENRLVTRIADLRFQTNLEDGGSFSAGRTLRFERLDEPFSIRRRLEIAPGDHHFNDWFVDLRSNPTAKLSGTVRYEVGDFWDGKRRGLLLGFSAKPHYRFTLDGRFQWDDLRLREGDLTSRLLSLRVDYSFSTQMFLSAFIQYNSDLRQVSSNLRFNLIHRPLSDIFIVYNDRRDTFQAGELDRALTFKYTHMLDLF